MFALFGLFAALGIQLGSAQSVCPGYNFAFLAQDMEGIEGSKLYFVLNSTCGVVVNQVCDNPCNCGDELFTCGTDSSVDGVYVHGMYYICRSDPNSGVCESGYTEGYAPESCVYWPRHGYIRSR
jgi:hypothetical protein